MCGTPASRATSSAASANSTPWISTTGLASLQMNSSSGTASRQFSGRKIAPSRRQANCSSNTSVSFMLSTATRSPRVTPNAWASHSAARVMRSSNCA